MKIIESYLVLWRKDQILTYDYMGSTDGPAYFAESPDERSSRQTLSLHCDDKFGYVASAVLALRKLNPSAPNEVSSDDSTPSNFGSTNTELNALARDLKILNYIKCRRNNELFGQTVAPSECYIINLQNSDQAGFNLVLYFVDHTRKLAFSNNGDPALQQLIDYLDYTPQVYERHLDPEFR